MNYKEGDTVSWEHGHAYLKVVKVIRIEKFRIRLRGSTSEYWMKRATFENNLGKAVPRTSSMANANTL